jgi:protein-tyrosine phosphatase
MLIAALLFFSSLRQEVPLAPYAMMPQTDAAMEVSNRSALVAWNRTADSVDVFVAASPERFGDTPAQHVVGQSFCILPLSSSSPCTFVRLVLHRGTETENLTVGSRFLSLQGPFNFRDLGGYRTADGHHVVWGKLFRSNGLDSLTEDDQKTLQAIHLGHVFDLRGDNEVKTNPDRLEHCPSIGYTRLPIESSGGLPKLHSNQEAEALFAAGYPIFAEQKAKTVFGPWLKALANGDPQPSVVHCAAGKDRTGVASAILLRLLGVDGQTVVADYSLTNLIAGEYLKQDAKQKTPLPGGLTLEELKPLSYAYPHAMELTLNALEKKFGSIEGYAKEACGLTDDDIKALRAQYLE